MRVAATGRVPFQMPVEPRMRAAEHSVLLESMRIIGLATCMHSLIIEHIYTLPSHMIVPALCNSE